MKDSLPIRVRLGVFELDLQAGELHKGDLKILLQEQPFQVLRILVEHAGELATREDIQKKLWPNDTFVEFDHGINTAIKRLRTALGDSAENPKYIETVARRGYRLIVPVERMASSSGDSPAVAAVAREHNETAAPGTHHADALRKRGSLVASAALLLAVAGYSYVQHKHSHQITEQDTVVLTDFSNNTGDPVFDGTLKQGLRVLLEQSPFLNVLSDQKVAQELSYMGRPRDTQLTPDLAREVCQRTACKALLAGSISSLGSHYVLTLAGVNCQSGDSLGGEQAEAESRETVLRMLGQAATKLRAKLGESLATIQKYDTPLEQASTTSLDALHAYSLGFRITAAKGDSAAMPFFQQAIDRDPNFAKAYVALAVAHYNLGEASLGAEAVVKAYGLREHVSERERLRIESLYYHLVTGDLEKAAQVYEVSRQTYPRDFVPYVNLGEIHSLLGQYESALTEFHEVQRLEPKRVSSYTNLAAMYVSLNRTEEAKHALEQAQALKLNSTEVVNFLYDLAFLRGDAAGMQRYLNEAMGQPGTEHELLAAQADTEAYHGRLHAARVFTQRAIESARREGESEAAADYAVVAALREAEFGNTDLARQQAKEALAMAPARDVKTLAALAFSRTAEDRQALAITDEMTQHFPADTLLNSYWLPTVRASVALHRHDAAAAVNDLQPVEPYELGLALPITTYIYPYPIYVRGQAYAAAGDGIQGAAEFQKILDHPGVVVNSPLGALAHLGLGRARALAGDAAGARTAYQDFFNLWNDADPDIPILKAAKTEYAKLK
jgi:DNA-binding winged helix-turn-helix (wHTH) protein/tetratricopeptide (TPR) repeat protein